mmetsp:Transcript_18930/g.33647  ORF Transcript_18930/g.33647 Transcript_18930/m.33647 type:complete len:225 (-) Transcript_18930:33-707(-)
MPQGLGHLALLRCRLEALLPTLWRLQILVDSQHHVLQSVQVEGSIRPALTNAFAKKANQLIPLSQKPHWTELHLVFCVNHSKCFEILHPLDGKPLLPFFHLLLLSIYSCKLCSHQFSYFPSLLLQVLLTWLRRRCCLSLARGRSRRQNLRRLFGLLTLLQIFNLLLLFNNANTHGLELFGFQATLPLHCSILINGSANQASPEAPQPPALATDPLPILPSFSLS